MKTNNKPKIIEGFENHKKPTTRRDFLGLGMTSGVGYVLAPSVLDVLFARRAYGADCAGGGGDGGMAGFICIDLAGGANIAGGNVMVGKNGSQDELLADYKTLGLLPNTAQNVDSQFGLKFHAQSTFLAGLVQTTTALTREKMEGAVFCTASGDDTGNNPHNPMYWVNKAGAQGELVSLVGTRAGDSGGRSQAPATSIDATKKPVQITKAADAQSLVSLGKLATILGNNTEKAEKVLRAVEKLSASQLAAFNNKDLPSQIKDLVQCGYINSTDMIRRYEDPTVLDASADTLVTQAFQTLSANVTADERAKMTAIAKLVVDKYAGTGTVELTGYDYHNNTRATGNARDKVAGELVGAAFELARLKERDLVVYIFTDGGVTSNGAADAGAGGLPRWTGDSGQRSAAFMLTYTHAGKAKIRGSRQIGSYKDSGAVDTAANKISTSVDNLAKAVVANYLALHGKEGDLAKVVGDDPFGAELEQYLVFAKG